MTRQNRVLPTGDIVAIPLRGAFMGNRGILHDDQGHLGPKRWRHRNWVCCRLEFKGRKRPPMAPGRYTELFFFDEAVALAAGHRPCAECRRADYERFRDAWAVAFGVRPSAKVLDSALHASRAVPRSGRLRRHLEPMESLPDGVFVEDEGVVALVYEANLWPLTDGGYGSRLPRRAADVVVLTPAVTVGVLRAGYRPAVAVSA